MGLFTAFQPPIVGLLDKFELDQAPAETNEKELLAIEGTKAGFIPWLLQKLGANQDMAISFNNRTVTVKEGRMVSMYPTSEVFDFSVGYSKDKRYLFLAIFGLIYCIIPGILIFYFVYQKSGALTVEVNFQHNQSARNAFKTRKISTKVKIDDALVATTISKVREIVYNNSRYYQPANFVNPSDI